MKEALSRKLVESAPRLYGIGSKRPLAYFEVQDGWYNILLDLSKKLEVEIQRSAVEHNGLCSWCDHPENSHQHEGCIGEENCFCIEFAIELPQAVQVKEKFGGLRFYMSQETPEMSLLIDEACLASKATCEVCAEKGRLHTIGMWVSCLCDKHAEKQNRKIADRRGAQTTAQVAPK